jgi:hypothetical protein
MAKDRSIACTMSWRAYLSADKRFVRLARYDMPHGILVPVSEAGELLGLIENANASLAGRSDGPVDERLLSKAELLLTPWEVLNIAHSRLEGRAFGGLNINVASRIVMLLKVASEMLIDYPFQRARAERMIGEIWWAQDERQLALEHFHRANRIDPKVGVKRMIKKIERFIAIAGE